MLIYPSGYKRPSGVYWELLFRMRANNLKINSAAVSPTWIPNAENESYRHTVMVIPTKFIVWKAGDLNEIVIHDVDPELVRQARDEVHCCTRCCTQIHNRADFHSIY